LPVNSIEKPYHFVGSTSDNHVALWVPTDEWHVVFDVWAFFDLAFHIVSGSIPDAKNIV
jgi:hypothetical protein